MDGRWVGGWVECGGEDKGAASCAVPCRILFSVILPPLETQTSST